MSHYLPGILLAILLAFCLASCWQPDCKIPVTCTHITAGIHAATLTPYGAFTAMHNDHSGLLICNISSVLFAVFMPPAEQVYLPADIKKPPAFPCGGRG